MESFLKIQWVFPFIWTLTLILILIGSIQLGSNRWCWFQRSNRWSETRCQSKITALGYGWSRTIQVKQFETIHQGCFHNLIHLSSLSRSITRAYYRNSVGVLLIYDTTNYVSFTHVTSWLNEARAQIQPYHAVFLLVGTKIDRASERQVIICQNRIKSNSIDMLFFSLFLVDLGYDGGRQSLCWLSQHFIHWNFVKIFFICSRSICINSSRDLWYVNRRANSCAEWVSLIFLSLFNPTDHWMSLLIRWEGVKAGPRLANANQRVTTTNILQPIEPTRSTRCCNSWSNSSLLSRYLYPNLFSWSFSPRSRFSPVLFLFVSIISSCQFLSDVHFLLYSLSYE